MKPIAISTINGETEITIETGMWIFKRQTTYRTAGRIAGKFFNWVKLPKKTIVPSGLSFQLDTWKQIGI